MTMEDFAIIAVFIWLFMATLGMAVLLWISLPWWIAAFITIGFTLVLLGAFSSYGAK